MRKSLLFFTLILLTIKSYGQGRISGDFMMNLNFFQRDSSIKASDNPLYDKYLNGNEAWLDLRYTNGKGFTAFARADVFNNSNLKNPTQANTAFGLGAWSVSKEMKDLSITVGYIYDQIGSGILFRSYEDRGLLIDNALVGLELKYKLTDNITLKGFTGQQKDNDIGSNPLTLSQRYAPIIKGFNAEGDFSIANNKVELIPGIGVLNRTLDQGSMDAVVSSINSQPVDTRFEPMYNMYAFTVYNTLTVGNFSWYAEGAYKTHEAILENNELVDKPGNAEYTTLGYAQKGIAVNLTGKRTQDFVMRTSPNEVLLNGMLNWQPVVARLRPQRLMSRYTPASQDISEQALGLDVLLSPNDYLSITVNGTYINTLDNVTLYREGYVEADYQGQNSWIINGGVQIMQYNQELYQIKANAPMVNAITPFAEVTYKINDKKSIRTEWEYMNTQQDYGSWIFGLVEFTIAPRFSFSVSDMYNIAPNKAVVTKANHYYNIFTSYTKGANRFTLSYVKQVDGINCTGGVCRYEPAFSGVKATVTSSF